MLDMNFALGPLEKIFRPRRRKAKDHRLRTDIYGRQSNKTDNPALRLTPHAAAHTSTSTRKYRPTSTPRLATA